MNKKLVFLSTVSKNSKPQVKRYCNIPAKLFTENIKEFDELFTGQDVKVTIELVL